ncbi:MAG: hypothetical protein JNL47_08665, partial [Bacteroidia bacterium]|nr:hypothetical protein [Bacteroidia bacterium]
CALLQAVHRARVYLSNSWSRQLSAAKVKIIPKSKNYSFLRAIATLLFVHFPVKGFGGDAGQTETTAYIAVESQKIVIAIMPDS